MKEQTAKLVIEGGKSAIRVAEELGNTIGRRGKM